MERDCIDDIGLFRWKQRFVCMIAGSTSVREKNKG